MTDQLDSAEIAIKDCHVNLANEDVKTPEKDELKYVTNEAHGSPTGVSPVGPTLDTQTSPPSSNCGDSAVTPRHKGVKSIFTTPREAS